MPEAEYLAAMHAAVTGLALDGRLSETDRLSQLIQLYRERLEVWRELSPAGPLAEAHAEIVHVCEEMLRRFRMVTTVEELTSAHDLPAVVERGAAAFQALQRESDRLGLGLSFR